MGNTLKTAFLLTLLTLLFIWIGGHFGGRNGLILGFLFAAGMNFFTYFYSDKLALKMYKAQPVTREELPRAYEVVERMTQRHGHSHAEDVCNSNRVAECVRDRPKSKACIGRDDTGNSAAAE